jgi:hypothetical protein
MLTNNKHTRDSHSADIRKQVGRGRAYLNDAFRYDWNLHVFPKIDTKVKQTTTAITFNADGETTGHNMNGKASNLEKDDIKQSTNNGSDVVKNEIDQVDSIEQMLNNDIFKKCLEPDDWQMVEYNLSYVHSAHLHPDSNETSSVVQVIGAMIKHAWVDKNSTHRQTVKCKVWTWTPGVAQPTVHITKVDEIVLQYGVRGYVNCMAGCYLISWCDSRYSILL